MATGEDATWIERFEVPPGPGSLVAVKDLIDVAGSVTTAGSRAVAERARPARSDAACIAALRRAGSRLAGKANLYELAYGVSGVNKWYGTPENPADPGRIPGGSSSGSAVAVARGEVDWALGTDTGGSVRIPAACCGIVGLKTTHGRVPLEGVWPLAPSFDTVGPLAPDVAGIVQAMSELEAGFTPAERDDWLVGRLRLRPESAVDPVIEEAVDAALSASELSLRQVELADWSEAWRQQQLLLGEEAFAADGHLLAAATRNGLSEEVAERLSRSKQAPDVLFRAAAFRRGFMARIEALLEEVALLALPTLPCRPALLGEPTRGFNLLVAPLNLAGLPSLTLPVPARGRPATGLQLVGRRGAEELLVAAAAVLEEAVRS